MGTIRAHEFMTLDGVIDTPTWSFDYGYDPQMGRHIGELMGSCSAILLGRTTYQLFEPAWSSRTAEEDPGAPFMNETPKYVVSASLRTATWSNSEIVGPYTPETVRRLKQHVDGGIYVSGSGTLVRALIADELLDEVHLFVFPLTRGQGPRLFPAGVARQWALARSETYANGVLYLVYRAAD